jgi:hypothetical protein
MARIMTSLATKKRQKEYETTYGGAGRDDTNGPVTISRATYHDLSLAGRISASLKFGPTGPELSIPVVTTPPEHDDKITRALASTKQWLIQGYKDNDREDENEREDENDDEDDEDGSDNDYDVCMGPGPGATNDNPSPEQRAIAYYYFIDALPFCDAVNVVFDVNRQNQGNRRTEISCNCPIGKQMEPWRTIFNLGSYNVCKKTQKMNQQGLMDHLRTKGHALTKHETCTRHKIVHKYLQELYFTTDIPPVHHLPRAEPAHEDRKRKSIEENPTGTRDGETKPPPKRR